MEQFLFLLDEVLREFRAGPAAHLRRARASFRKRCAAPEHGESRRCSPCAITATRIGRYFEHVDHVFTCSPYLSEVYRQQIGLPARASSRRSTGRKWRRRTTCAGS